ncbi:Crp/Fnr family transcriptional regulator [Mucilaginibacter rubeus]|uniref:Crp/Fnr family transcriptional regulator n=1 Tax=Mucilaginibacter rubeus TaxID=2027860 RepID=A0AAE6JLZ0_9SPHI|nr:MULTISPECIES: Crp/Fnr family transcriptional regulator [Mucilaginibacter]QEM07801.1 Crp/Fnr family transcriptional regulator [Mucilaginibacter rubeus]QEM20253.1 Crp/Fnr family transcriptional regulator [Mucilaginibacter gossypii]QTE43029.1 Crp/Fnr family transcriptional regulator [Mucilaginibacter rubeus]QTE49630.1 Crp/Fnr family transcriptional regulator [Mucilaginibacter rubeus]QTE54725.1 Crp/Fnr family transcriptional regulator [Mucilaginibacter rubeus]
MNTEPFISFLESITDLSEGLRRELSINLSREHYKPHQIIQSEDQTENRLWFLISGMARGYIYDEQRQQHTLRFWHPGEVIFSYAGFLKQPSKEYIELLTDSELSSCNYLKIEQFMREYPETIKLVGIINRRFLQKEYKTHQLHAMKGKHRYQLFRKEHPEVFAHVPQWIIASYLQMTRENLTRIISKEQKKSQ